MRHRKLVLAKNILFFFVTKKLISKEWPDCKPREFIYSPTELHYSSVILGKKFSEVLCCLPSKCE